MFDSYRNLMSRGSICGRLLEKTVCLHLSLSLLNETSKWYSSRMKVVWDLKLSFDRYQNLVSRRTWLPTISRVTVFLRLLSKYRTKRRNYFFQTKVVGDSLLIATENSCPGETFCGQLLEKRNCYNLSLRLLNETPKGYSSWLKAVDDQKLSFDRYQRSVSWWILLPTLSGETVFLLMHSI